MKQNIMKIFSSAALFLFLTALFASAQTQDSIAIQSTSPVNYSESVSYEPRKFFPDEKSKPKKERKPEKKKALAANESTKSTASFLPKDEAITIPVSVFNAKGEFVENLKQSDFKIFADGKEQEILSIGKLAEPVNVVLLIDTSPSTANKIEQIQNYALATVERLKPEDKVMVIEFNVKTRVLAELTSDRQVIANAVRKAKFGDGTALYEAVNSTFDKYIRRIQGRTAVILLTDGVDTTSYRSNYADSLLTVEKMNASVFPIYFDTFSDIGKITKKTRIIALGAGSNLPFPVSAGQTQGSTVADYELGKLYLIDISIVSGGRSRVVKDITNTRAENVDNIGGEMRVQYQVTFRPTEFSNGQRKQIRVRVNRPNLRIQARGSLIAGKGNETAVIK
jgi:VWFA-related protein